jgi:molybdenum-dependent DNA-binding transcriptional regulator ModE
MKIFSFFISYNNLTLDTSFPIITLYMTEQQAGTPIESSGISGQSPNAENKPAKSAHFKTAVTKIQSKPLSPENIDLYAENALTDLIILTSSIVEEYSKEEPPGERTGKEIEDAAFAHFGLSNLGDTLSYIATKAEEIRDLDLIITRAENVDSVIVPTEGHKATVNGGKEAFKDKSIIARTKTVLFILSNDFNVDVDNPTQLILKTGTLTDNMMRQLSYFMASVPRLKRTILCCDEEGNATYIFDHAVLREHGFSPEDLAGFSKPGLNALLDQDPRIGRRLVYSRKFVPNIISLIENPQANINSPDKENTGFYLYPKAIEGDLSPTSFAKTMGIAYKTVANAIVEIGVEKLGETPEKRFGSKKGPALSPLQQNIIAEYLRSHGKLAEQAPSEVLSLRGLSVKFNIDHLTIRTAINAIGTEILGETPLRKFFNRTTEAYTPAQQGIIEEYLRSHGKLAEQAQEGELSINGIAKKLGIANVTIAEAVRAIGSDNLGNTSTRRFTTLPAEAYTPAQQGIIEEYLRSHGKLAEQAPEGVLSLSSLAAKFGLSRPIVKKAIEDIGDALGEIIERKFSGKPAEAYTPAQQGIIEEYLRSHGKLAEQAPKTVLSANGLSRKLGVSFDTMDSAIENLGDKLGESYMYRFGPNKTTGYSEEQQIIIVQYLQNNGILVEKPPEGVLSAYLLAKRIGTSYKRVVSAIADLGDELGEVHEYKSQAIPTKGFTQKQQEMIIKKIAEGRISTRRKKL